jgi:hypothetical protein
MAAVTGVTTSEALEHIIGEDVDRMTHRDQIRMGALLKEVGWLPIGRPRPRRYRPVPVPAT